MIELGSAPWWAICAAVVLAVRTLPDDARPRTRALVYLAGLVGTFALPTAWPTLAALGAVAGYGYLAARTPRAYPLHLVVLTGLFIGSQYGAPALRGLHPALQVLPLVGLAYVYLRLLHLLTDVRRGELSPPPLVQYVTWLLPMHQLLAGPIERYPAFEEKLSRPLTPLTRADVLAALDRLTNGLVKKFVLADLLLRSFGFALERQGLPLWAEVNLQALYIYLDFSGYMDIALGLGMLLGWTPPENFRNPYFSRNLVEFWTRWHITLGDWIRDYIFNPLNLAIQRRIRTRKVLWTGIVCYLVAMLFCGLWHRTNPQFALWGALHGVGIGVYKLYEAALKKRLSKPALKAYRASRVARFAGTFVTFQYIAFSFVFAFQPPATVLDVFRRLFP